jgi:hypothetical protein
VADISPAQRTRMIIQACKSCWGLGVRTVGEVQLLQGLPHNCANNYYFSQTISLGRTTCGRGGYHVVLLALHVLFSCAGCLRTLQPHVHDRPCPLRRREQCAFCSSGVECISHGLSQGYCHDVSKGKVGMLVQGPKQQAIAPSAPASFKATHKRHQQQGYKTTV